MQINYRSAAIGGTVAALVVGCLMWNSGGQKWFETSPAPSSLSSHGVAPLALPATTSRDGQVVTLNQSQLQHIKTTPVELHDFADRREAIGNIDFDQDHAVQVFTSYQDRIRSTYAKVGDMVAKGESLSDIDSPDLVQAESMLISTAGTYKLTTAAPVRTRQLSEIQGLAQKDLDQAISDQQATGVAYKAAREALIVSGKAPAQMNQIVETRKIDSLLTIMSPISGQVTARSARSGLLLQLDNGATPFTVADVSTMRIQAFVPEADAPLLHVDQPVRIHVMAFSGRIFSGKITTVGAPADANTHRILVRSEIDDPKHKLRPSMFTLLDITIDVPIQSPALAMDDVVHEGDGAMTAWVTTDHKHFVRHVTKFGLKRDGFMQVLESLSVGELAANEGALYLSTATAGSFNGVD